VAPVFSVRPVKVEKPKKPVTRKVEAVFSGTSVKAKAAVVAKKSVRVRGTPA
jgi:hypothetical protein